MRYLQGWPVSQTSRSASGNVSACAIQADVTEAYLEDGLHLRELRPGMFACQHLDNKATDTPDVGFLRICGLLDDFRCHPEHRSLQRRPVCSVTREQV